MRNQGSASPGPVYHYPLDAIRLASALLVAGFHLGFYSWASEYSSTARALRGAAAFPWALPWTWFGFVGVEIFFVISGFVIANSARGASPGRFVEGRALRLLPAAWICATITLLARAGLGGDALGGLAAPYARSMTLWLSGPWIDGVYWSLAVEIVFYALVALLLILGRFALLPKVAWALTGAAGAFILLDRAPQLHAHAVWRAIEAHADVLLLEHGAFFAIGIWLWL
ncbi:acyltransferase family protein [Phenylobacterium sp.]|uniref:acyltransferase family protein n=1 Tax=Phenylobacterium sp. TaxID=1871053 RepID=UPI0035B274CA